jgi:ubiquinone/menaquinone biosynthesis C-methylase UbiE
MHAAPATEPSCPTTRRGPAGNPGTVSADDMRRLALLTVGLKQRIRALLDLAPGQRVLDVGCGPGLDARAVAESVGPAGRVAAIDYDPAMIRAAHDTDEARATGIPRVWYQLADAAGIPYRTNTFNGCYSERVLQHTSNAAAVVSEMARVTKPGGVIVVADTDWATLSIDAPEPAVERALVRFVGDALRNGLAGRQLRRLMKTADLRFIEVEAWPLVWTDYTLFRSTSLSLMQMERRAVGAGALSADDVTRLDEALLDADRRGEFFASAAVIVARGRKNMSDSRQVTQVEK